MNLVGIEGIKGADKLTRVRRRILQRVVSKIAKVEPRLQQEVAARLKKKYPWLKVLSPKKALTQKT